MGSVSASGPSLRSRPDRVYKRTAKEAIQGVTSRTKATYYARGLNGEIDPTEELSVDCDDDRAGRHEDGAQRRRHDKSHRRQDSHGERDHDNVVLVVFNLAGLPYPAAYDNFLIVFGFLFNGLIVWYASTWVPA